jgi:hypothetical protein
MIKFGEIGESRSGFRGVALIGDIVASRELEDRAGFQRRLKGLLGELNRTLGPGILVAPLALTAGDELQGLFRRPEAVVEATALLDEGLRPARILFGVGWGGLSTEASERVAEMDGVSFHRARAALAEAARGDAWAVARGFGETEDRMLSALFRLLGVLRSRWTEKQAGYAAAARTRLQKEVAAAFGVSPSVVSESLKAAAFDAVREGEEALSAYLAGVGSRPAPARNEES